MQPLIIRQAVARKRAQTAQSGIHTLDSRLVAVLERRLEAARQCQAGNVARRPAKALDAHLREHAERGYLLEDAQDVEGGAAGHKEPLVVVAPRECREGLLQLGLLLLVQLLQLADYGVLVELLEVADRWHEQLVDQVALLVVEVDVAVGVGSWLLLRRGLIVFGKEVDFFFNFNKPNRLVSYL